MNRLIPALVLLCASLIGVIPPAGAAGLSPAPVLTDSLPPAINCPANVTIAAAAGECTVLYTYLVVAYDNEPGYVLTQTAGLAPGDSFPVGVTVNTFLVTDASGNTASCSFSVTVTGQFPNTNPVCRDNTIIPLEDNCIATVQPEDILLGTYGCDVQFYNVEIDKTPPYGNGPWIAPVVGHDDLNKTYMLRVRDTHGNLCLGQIKVVDDEPPTLSCADFYVSCMVESMTPGFLHDSLGISAALPQATDNCGTTTNLFFFDITTPGNCASRLDKTLERVWNVDDAEGNTDTCHQHIYVVMDSLLAVQFPPNVTLDCSDDPDISIDALGTPFITAYGRHYSLSESCALGMDYTNTTQLLPCSGRQINRNWAVFDWCTNETFFHTQIITILDQTGPIISCPPSLTVTVPTAVNCAGPVALPNVILTDGCSEVASISASWTVNGNFNALNGNLVDFPANDPNDLHDTLGVVGTAPQFPVGVTVVEYMSLDLCGNTGTCRTTVNMRDTMPPVAVCPPLFSISLAPDGSFAMSTDTLNYGSYDACTPVSLKIRRTTPGSPCNPPFGFHDEVYFCCEDLVPDTVLVTLRVYDIPVPDSMVGENYGLGHFTDCTMLIHVQDSLPPTCNAPADLTVNCQDFDPTLMIYGTLTYQNCSVDSVAFSTDWSAFDTLCSLGSITRHFQVFDEEGNSGECTQHITVNYAQRYYIHFPDDKIVTMCDSAAQYGEPTFFGLDCENLDIDYDDVVFYVIPDACFKIERTWTIRNLCAYDPDAPFIEVPNPTPNPSPNHPNNLPGPIVSDSLATGVWAPSVVKVSPLDPTATNFSQFWSLGTNGYRYTQIIKVIDTQDPTIAACPNGVQTMGDETVNNSLLWNDQVWLDPVTNSHDLCEGPADLTVSATDICSGSDLEISYLLFLDLDADGIMETVVDSKNLPGFNTVNFNNYQNSNYTGGVPRNFDERPLPLNQKYGFALQTITNGKNKIGRVRWNSEQASNSYAVPQLPYGTHKVRWKVVDNCGNETTCEYTFTVKDVKKPDVFCLNNVSVNLGPGGSATVTDSTFLENAVDNCTPQSMLVLAINRDSAGAFPADGNGHPITALHFTCDDLDSIAIPIQIWSRDLAGNAGFCQTLLVLKDTIGYCTNPDGINGFIKTENQVGVKDVLVTLDCPSPGIPPSLLPLILTDSSGYYTVPLNLPINNCTLKPEKDSFPLNGVTTFDLVLMSKHILGLQPLTSPYQQIAADINQSGSITTYDIVELRKLILAIYNEFPNNHSWRFVPKLYVFPDPENPFSAPFPETMSVPEALANGGDFVAIKIGDINGSADPYQVAGDVDTRAGTPPLLLDVNGDREVQAGEVYAVTFSAAEPTPGFQFTLKTNGLELLGLQPGMAMSAAHFALGKNRLVSSWNSGAGGAEMPAFTLQVRAMKAGRLSEMLALSDEVARAEAYPLSGEKPMGIALRFGNAVAEDFALYQNQPNPFHDRTSIAFRLPEAEAATLSVFDAAGRLLFSRSGDFEKGYNAVEVPAADWPAGTLSYRLETATHTAVRKMVVFR